nr:DUF4157 domain-containing protein [Aquimarina mytili]
MADQVVQKLNEPSTEVSSLEDRNKNVVQTKSAYTTIQNKCDECEDKEQLQKKEEETQEVVEDTPEIQEKPIFESEATDKAVQTKTDVVDPTTETISEVVSNKVTSTATSIQAKCDECEKEEVDENAEDKELQKKEVVNAAGDPSDEEDPNLQLRSREMENTEYPILFKKIPNVQLSGGGSATTGSRERIVEEAQKMVGKIEAKKDDGSGRRVGAEHLLEIFHLAAKDEWPDEVIENVRYTKEFPHWCGIFSVYAIKKAGIDLGYWQMGKGVSAFGTLQPTDNPQPGDIGYFTKQQHHCIIKAVNGDMIDSIDGNSGNFSEVKERTRPRSQFHAFFTPFTGSETIIQNKQQDSVVPSTSSDSLQNKLNTSAGKGTTMDSKTRNQMESGFGIDFSGVNIHTDSSAVQMSKELGAQAFTHGNDIYFNEGKYDTNTTKGKHLLAHELTHTIQQGASVQKKETPQIQKNEDAATSSDEGTPRFIVEDTEIPSSEQLTKTVFIDRLNERACAVTNAAFANTPFTAELCPYLTRAISRLRTLTPIRIEALLLRYDTQLQNAVNLEQFFEIFGNRVRVAATNWLENGDLSGIPDEIITQIPDSIRRAVRIMGAVRSGMNTVTSGISSIASGVSSVVSGIGSLFFKSKTGGSKPSQAPQNILQTLEGGSTLEAGTRSKMEGAFGASFSDVKIHTDSNAANLSNSMNARAFTLGNHVAFGSGQYKPGSMAGDALLAHELAHVQQQKGSNSNTVMEKNNQATDSLLEEQADDTAVNAVAQIWTKSNEQEIEIPKTKMPEIKSGLKLQRCFCGGEPAPRWNGDVSELQIELYTTTNINETPVDPGEAITRDFPSFVARLNYHDYTYPRVTQYHMWDENHEDPVGPRFPTAPPSGVSRIPMPPIGQYTLEANILTGVRSMPQINLSRPIRIIESYRTLSERQSVTDLADQEGRTVANELLNYEQFSAIIRQNAVSVAGVSQELVDAWNSAQAQAIIIEAAINQTISAGQSTEAKTAFRGFYNQLRTEVSNRDVFHPETTEVEYDGLSRTTITHPAYTTNAYITAGTNRQNISALNGGSSPENWRNYLDKFYDVTGILNRYISDKLRLAGFTDSARQLEVSGAYSNHLRKLYRDHPDAQPVQAVFYPKLQANLRNDAEDDETPHYNLTALPQKMYTYRTDDGVWHLLDITRHNRAFNTEESGGSTTVPPRSLITELDSAERFPEGMMHWKFKHGTPDKCEMTHPWSASEILNLISMVLAVAGVVALVAASGGALAPVVPTLIFVASGLAQAASSAAHIHESSELGTLTPQSLAVDAFGIAAGLFGAAAAGTGHIVKAAQASEAAWTGFRGLSALGAQAIYRPVQIAGIAADFGSLIAFSAQAADQYDAIAAMPEGEAKTLAQRRLVAMSLLTGGMTIISIRGGMHDIGAGRTLYLDLTTINGVRTPVAHRVMPQVDILAHPRLGSARADVEAFLARTDLNETTFNRFRGELSVALNTAGMSEAEIRAFVRRMGTVAGVAEARTILTQFRNSRVAVAVGGVSRSAGYDLSYMHTSPQDFQTTVRGTFTQEGSIVHNGSLTHVEGADISNYTMHIDAADGGRVEADVVVVYSDFTAGSAIGTGTVAPGAATGPARNTVVWNSTTNRWTVRVEVDQRLAPKDIPRALGHELDEAGDVINRLHGNQGPDVNQRIADLQRPGMFTGGSMTSHDLASLREINTLLATASTNPGAANSLSILLRDLGLTADSGLFQARLTRVLSSGHISSDRIVLLEAWSTYDIAVARGSRLRRFTREEFIAEYQRGKRFDEGGSNRWYNLNTDRANTRQFFTDAEIADPNLAFNRLAGTGSRSSFRPYYEMLTSNGIASEARVRRRFNELLASPRGRDLDFVRHSLKDAFKNDIMTYLTNRQRLTTAHPGKTFEEASHIEMMRITNDLNSSDKGSLSERWYSAVYDPDSLTHVQFTGASGTTRYADLLNEDGTMKDLKYIREALSARELEQFDDYRLMIGQDVTVTNADGSTNTIRVQRLRYSFMNPSGVRANAEWMHGILSSPSTNITFEIFNAHGQRRIVTRAGIFEMGAGNRSMRVGGIDLLTDAAQLRLWLNL